MVGKGKEEGVGGWLKGKEHRGQQEAITKEEAVLIKVYTEGKQKQAIKTGSSDLVNCFSQHMSHITWQVKHYCGEFLSFA